MEVNATAAPLRQASVQSHATVPINNVRSSNFALNAAETAINSHMEVDGSCMAMHACMAMATVLYTDKPAQLSKLTNHRVKDRLMAYAACEIVLQWLWPLQRAHAAAGV